MRGAQKPKKLRPRGVGPRVEVKGLQSTVKNCCHNLEGQTLQRWWREFDGRRPQKQQQEKQQRSRIGARPTWPRPLLPRPCLATTYFGHDLFWPRSHRLWPRSIVGIFEGRGGVGRGNGGPRGRREGAEGVGTQTPKKGGGKKGGGPKGWGPERVEAPKGWGAKT